jgi:hypothetical protein
MRIIEIAPLENGAHRNQTYNGALPEGWAVVPDTLATESFPFGDITVEDVNGIPTVTSWTPGAMPEPEPVEPEPTTDEITDAEMAAAILEGVNDV